ncbi:MAG: ABC transporter ATP-binding protein [Acidobacteriota bacterium]
MKNIILKVEGLKKSFQQPDKTELTVLKDLSFVLQKKKILAVTGASGSGKSTLLHLIGSFENPDEGDILFEGKSILNFSKKRINRYRNSDIGFLYQFHYLMPELTILENVMFPSLIKLFDKDKSRERGIELLKSVGLGDKLENMPFQLSGGERQRAAIARSLINSPKLLLADEPTGNLDWRTGEKVFGLFSDLIKDKELSAIIVTHNEKLAGLSDNKFFLH